MEACIRFGDAIATVNIEDGSIKELIEIEIREFPFTFGFNADGELVSVLVAHDLGAVKTEKIKSYFDKTKEVIGIIEENIRLTNN